MYKNIPPTTDPNNVIIVYFCTMAKQKNVVKEVSTVTIDGATGEVTEIQKVQSYSIEQEPPFVKLYLSDIVRLKELPPATSTVLHAILQVMNYQSKVMLMGFIKKEMCENLGMSMNTLNKAIDNLHKSGILIRIATGYYVVDPELFGKGSWKDIKNIRLQIDYTTDDKGRTIKKLKSNIAEEQHQLNLFNAPIETEFEEVKPKGIGQNNDFDNQ